MKTISLRFAIAEFIEANDIRDRAGDANLLPLRATNDHSCDIFAKTIQCKRWSKSIPTMKKVGAEGLLLFAAIPKMLRRTEVYSLKGLAWIHSGLNKPPGVHDFFAKFNQLICLEALHAGGLCTVVKSHARKIFLQVIKFAFGRNTDPVFKIRAEGPRFIRAAELFEYFFAKKC